MQRVHVPYRAVYRFAIVATILMLVIIPLQVLAFAMNPIPASTQGWFELMADKPLLGLFHADFFLMVNNILIAIIYLAFYQSLKRQNKGLMQIALALGLVGIAAYISSNKTFELFILAREFRSAGDQATRQLLLAAGKATLVGWQGTAFDAYYVLNGITLVLVSSLMLRSKVYGKTTAIIGLVAGFFMVIPSTAGTIGLVFSLLSLIPWYIFAIRFCLVFVILEKTGIPEA
jgi:hypothetical protein